jgi:hypothetical protein
MFLKKIGLVISVSLLLTACKKENLTVPSEPTDAEIKVQNSRVVFSSGQSFESFFLKTSTERAAVLETISQNANFTSLKKKKELSAAGATRMIGNCDVPDELVENNEDFFALLDVNGVIQIGTFLYRYDYCNNKAYVTSAVSDNDQTYSDFLAGNTSNTAVGWFETYVDVIDAVESGYTTMPDPATVAGNEIFQDSDGSQTNSFFGGTGHEWKYFNDLEYERDHNNARMDGKISYDKFGFYFHFYAKEKYQKLTYIGFITASDGTRDWKVDFSYSYRRKGQSSPRSGSGTNVRPPLAGENKLGRDFYEGSRGLHWANARWDVWNHTNYHRVVRGPFSAVLDYTNRPLSQLRPYYANYQFTLPVLSNAYLTFSY